jgi:cell division septation protein DedD
MSDDPRGFRRGQPGNRDQAAPQQGRGGRGAPPRDDRFDNFRQPESPAGRQPEKHQPSFSAYRPEAYAAQERSPARLAPTSEPFPRAQQDRDPYRGGQNSGDPYAAPNGRGYDNDWRADPYNDQAPSYYPPDEPAGGDAQSVHDRFFAPEPDRAPPPPPRYNDPEFGADLGNYPAAQRHSGVHGANAGFDDRREEEWDQPPAPTSVRPFHAPATIPDDDLDADFFADEDDYDAEEYPPEKGGRKKLMAAVLVGAVVTGGGLAYVYKTSGGAGDGYPSVISADSRPVKEEPADGPGTAGRDFPNGNKLIYDRLGGAAQEAGAAPTRLAGGSPSGKTETQGDVPTGGTLEQRIENALKAQKEEEPAAAQNRGGGAASADTPRTVRTMTFGPDGTQQAAESKTQRVAANNAKNALSSGVVVTTQPTSATTRDDPPPAEEPAETSAAASPAESAPAPRQTRTAAVAPQAAPQLTEAAGGSGNFFVQIAARNDQDAAMAAFASLQQKYAGVLGNHSPSVRKVDLGEKGVWFRLLVGPIVSKGEADQLCEQLKTAGMKGCFARKD